MKGRDKELIEARDRKIYERYYYWTEIKRIRFDDALHILSTEEFFLSESRVMQILRRLINMGYTLENGEKLTPSMFTGFRSIYSSRPRRAKRCADDRLSLFPELNR